MVDPAVVSVPVFVALARDYNYSIGASILINDTPTMI